MKKELKCFMLGAGVIALLMGSLTLAGNYSENVQRFYRDIKIKLNGSEITPKDATGKVVEPFIIDGTTYLPVRAVGEALGLVVDWNERTSTVLLDNSFAEMDISKEVANAFLNVIETEEYEGLKYNLVYFDNDDVPELLIDDPYYWMSIYQYQDGSAKEIGYEPYGTWGRGGYNYVPRESILLSYAHDNNGFAFDEYEELTENGKIEPTYSIAYPIGDDSKDKMKENGKLINVKAKELNFIELKGEYSASTMKTILKK